MSEKPEPGPITGAARSGSSRRARGEGDRARPNTAADAGHEPRGGDQLRARRRREDLGRHRHHPPQREDRRAPPRPGGERDLRGEAARARMRWGEQLEFTAEAGPGDFIYVPPYVPHQEINASADEPLECVLCAAARSRWW